MFLISQKNQHALAKRTSKGVKNGQDVIIQTGSSTRIRKRWKEGERRGIERVGKRNDQYGTGKYIKLLCMYLNTQVDALVSKQTREGD